MDQRRTRRFKLELPVAITRSGAERIDMAGITNNISSSGVSFTADREPDFGGPIEYIITLNHEGGEPVALRCVGKVLRSDPIHRERQSPRFRIAATLERYEFVRARAARQAPA